MTKAPNEFYEMIGNAVVDTIGVADGTEQLTKRLWAAFDSQYQALLDIADTAVPPGADAMDFVKLHQKIAAQGLGRPPDGMLPVYAMRPRD